MSGAAAGLAGPLVLAAAGGALCAFGFVGWGLWPLALVALVPLWGALEAVRPRGRSAGALAGLVFGLAAHALGFPWLWRVVDVFLGGNVVLGALLFVAHGLWFALRFALYGVLHVALRERGWSPATAAMPAWLVLEWGYPLLFPVHIGHALEPQLPLVQVADLGGPLLLTALVVLVNLAVFETWRYARRRRPRPVRVWVVTGAALALAWAHGRASLRAVDAAVAAAPVLRVGIVQGNVAVEEKGRHPERDHQRYLAHTREVLATGPLDLVVWPETVLTRGIRRPLPVSGRLVRGDVDVPLLFGAASVDGTAGRPAAYNSALLVGADGVIRDAYDKNLLIPFTEHLPFGAALPGSGTRLSGPAAFRAGTGTSALRLGPWRLAVPICHEIVQAAHVRRMVARTRPHLLATLANDAWFGDSQEPWIHHTLARFRAIEHRRFLVRATNSGISAIVDPAGRVVTRSGVLTQATLRGTVALLDGTTVYTGWGDWPGGVAAAVLLAALLTRRAQVTRPRGLAIAAAVQPGRHRP